MSAQVNFEVQTQSGGRWVTDGICRREEEARQLCEKLLQKAEGVRIVRNFIAREGEYPVETVIHTETREVRKKPLQVVAIEQANYCQTSEEFLGADSRGTISRLLRQYLEDKSLTASELLHNPGEMKRFSNYESLLPSAVSRVAGLQSKSTGEDSKVRRDAIYAHIDELRVKAEKALSGKVLPYPKETGWGAAMSQLEQQVGGDAKEAEYLGRVVLCRDLVNIRNLLGKVEWVLQLCSDTNADQRHIAMLDGVIADVVGSPQVVIDLLGRQFDLASALLRLMDVMQGDYTPLPREQAPEVTKLLSEFIASGNAPETSAVLMEFLVRQVRGSQKLGGNDPESSQIAFSKLLDRLFRNGVVYGGPRMAEALVLGYLRFVEQGGTEGRRAALDGVLGMLPWSSDRVGFMCQLSGTDLAKNDLDAFVGKLESQFTGAGGMNAMVDPKVPLKPKLQTIASLYLTVAGCDLPAEPRDKLADKIDTAVAEFISAQRIIEKLDDPTATLRMRAIRLISFASNDVLSSPKARKMVRNQILGYLRQPNFDQKFIEGLVPEEQALALRNFYDLLGKAQFI